MKTKTKKISRQTIVNRLEDALLRSTNTWNEEVQDLYEEILTTPHFAPLPLDAIVTMMYCSGLAVPHDTVQKFIQWGGKDLIATDYQIVSSYWKNALPHAQNDLMFLHAMGFNVYRLPTALIALLRLKTAQSDHIVANEIVEMNKRSPLPNSLHDPAYVVTQILCAAIGCGRLEVIRAVPQERFSQPAFVRSVLVPALLDGCSPTADTPLPAHALAVTQLILERVDNVCRQEVLNSLFNRIHLMIAPRSSFKQLSDIHKERVQKKLEYIEEILSVWNEKEVKQIKAVFTKFNLPPLAAFQAERIAKAVQSLQHTETFKRKM